MNSRGRILIADDEETFRCSTAELLARTGYEVDQASDAIAAASMMEGREYDVLVADIKMPGNPNLELVRQIKNGLPVILVTGYPDLSTAIESVGLSVVAYIVKPVDWEPFAKAVARAVSMSRACRGLGSMQRRIADWQEEIDQQKAAAANPRVGGNSVDAFVALTMRHITESLADLQQVTTSVARQDTPAMQICNKTDCDQLGVLRDAIRQTITTLEHTKSSFKSRELGELRHFLQRVEKSMVS